MNPEVPVSSQMTVSLVFEYIPNNKIIGSYGSSIFSFLKSLHTVFQRSHTNLHLHQEYIRVLYSLHPFHYLLFVAFWMIAAILKGVR